MLCIGTTIQAFVPTSSTSSQKTTRHDWNFSPFPSERSQHTPLTKLFYQKSIHDICATLGVGWNADAKEVKAAFRKLAKKFHPDVNPTGAEKFKQINEAYQILIDPQAKNNFLADMREYGGGFHEPFDAGFRNARASPRPPPASKDYPFGPDFREVQDDNMNPHGGGHNPHDVFHHPFDFTTAPFGSGNGYNDPDVRRKYDSAWYAEEQEARERNYASSKTSFGKEEQKARERKYASSSSSKTSSPFGKEPPSSFGKQVDFSRGNRQGEDLEVELEIDFKTSIFGGKEKVRIRRLENCEDCTGDGVTLKPESCGSCGGTGITTAHPSSRMHFARTDHVTCPTCKGSGTEKQVIDCTTCHGKGSKVKSKHLEITIPPGVEDGGKLRVCGEGDVGRRGGPAGDLYILLKVKPDPVFTRQGTELYSELSIAYLDAIMGISLTIPVVGGEVNVKIPPGARQGEVIRVAGNGAPAYGSPDARGDLHVTLNVEQPQETELFQKFQQTQQGTMFGFANVA